jgi:hypothetical protein
MLDFILKPKCPRFPDASLRIGKMAGWFYNFCSWLGLRLDGWIGRPFLRLSSRARDVEWARKPMEERMRAFSVVTVGCIGALMLFGDLGSGTVRPAGRIT